MSQLFLWNTSEEHAHLHPQQSPGSWEVKATQSNFKIPQPGTVWCCSYLSLTDALDTQFIIWSEPKELGSIKFTKLLLADVPIQTQEHIYH